MERIIIYGMGDEYVKNKEKIWRQFIVLGCTDSFKEPCGEWEKTHFICPEKLLNIDFDKILVCSCRYRDAIKIKLIKAGIDVNKFLFLEDLKEDDPFSMLSIINDMEEYARKNGNDKFVIREDSLCLIDNEKECEAGRPGIHYFAQDIWGAQKIYRRNPINHYDIGSSINGFIAHLLVFRELTYIDIRPLNYHIPGLHYLYGDAMNLENIESNSIESLSSFSALEHFGLGRYGDKVDPEGYIKGAKSMQRILCGGGHLYLSVPVGSEDKCVFNAHRIFRIETVLKLFDKCVLKDIAIVEPDGVWAHAIREEEYSIIKDFSCGLFEFEKV